MWCQSSSVCHFQFVLLWEDIRPRWHLPYSCQCHCARTASAGGAERGVVLVLPRRSARLKRERWFWVVSSALKNNLPKSGLGRAVCGRVIAAVAQSVLQWGKDKGLFAALRLAHLEGAPVRISVAWLRCQTRLRCQQHWRAQLPALRLLWLCPLQLSDSMLSFVCTTVLGACKVLSCKAICVWYLQSWSLWVGCPCCLRV